MEDCKYNLILDNRENELIKIFRSCFSQVFVSQLDVGDIAICQMKDKSAKILAIFERKTVNDMLASLKDGRYKEQKLRLMSNHCQDKTKRIYYILEGDTNSLT
jgi:ERCC4-type nuclease